MALYICGGPLASLMAWLVFAERLDMTEWFAMALCLLGVICIVRPPTLFHLMFGDAIDTERPSDVDDSGYIWASIATSACAFTMLCLPPATRILGKFQLLFYLYHWRWVGGAIILAYTGDWDIPQWEDVPVLITAVFMDTGSAIGWTYASIMMPIAHQSIIFSFDKVWAYGMGVALFKEKLHWLSVLGACEVFLLYKD
jgi:drug/metabolite transporter (DMT)-like permease